jgi:hypothetical protein
MNNKLIKIVLLCLFALATTSFGQTTVPTKTTNAVVSTNKFTLSPEQLAAKVRDKQLYDLRVRQLQLEKSQREEAQMKKWIEERPAREAAAREKQARETAAQIQNQIWNTWILTRRTSFSDGTVHEWYKYQGKSILKINGRVDMVSE